MHKDPKTIYIDKPIYQTTKLEQTRDGSWPFDWRAKLVSHRVTDRSCKGPLKLKPNMWVNRRAT